MPDEDEVARLRVQARSYLNRLAITVSLMVAMFLGSMLIANQRVGNILMLAGCVCALAVLAGLRGYIGVRAKLP